MATLLADPPAGLCAVTHRQEHPELRRENVRFIEPEMWPLNSPDLNPVDYTLFGVSSMVYRRRRFTPVEQLKNAIITEWGKLSQRFINRALDQWRRRLQRVVQERRGHIEHCL